MRTNAPRLPDALAARLRDRIMAGDLRPGDHLHLERLAEELGVSVTPVREALLALRGDGFVTLEPRRGFTVAPLDCQDFEDAHRLQAVIGGELAARAASRISAAQLAELAALHEEMQLSSPFVLVDVGELVTRFHTTVSRVAESPKLAWFLDVARRYTPHTVLSDLPDWREIAVADHHAVLSALQHRDPVAARVGMQRHVVRTGELLIRHLQQRGLWPEPENPPLPGRSASHPEQRGGR
ncbi:GntR family transcriptional regulator [Saccharopolyspora thermophila]|nr:GntR family transcriptional regulator [Saccharopolyspora subtropica]